MIDLNRLEVLAPAGDMERFDAALLYGADAIYLGGQSFGMRSSPANFSFEQLKSACEKAHARGVKVYLTCNTLPKNSEIAGFEGFTEAEIYAAEFDETLPISISDFNRDRVRNIKDATAIQKHLAGIEE